MAATYSADLPSSLTVGNTLAMTAARSWSGVRPSSLVSAPRMRAAFVWSVARSVTAASMRAGSRAASSLVLVAVSSAVAASSLPWSASRAAWAWVTAVSMHAWYRAMAVMAA